MYKFELIVLGQTKILLSFLSVQIAKKQSRKSSSFNGSLCQTTHLFQSPPCLPFSLPQTQSQALSFITIFLSNPFTFFSPKESPPHFLITSQSLLPTFFSIWVFEKPFPVEILESHLIQRSFCSNSFWYPR